MNGTPRLRSTAGEGHDGTIDQMNGSLRRRASHHRVSDLTVPRGAELWPDSAYATPACEPAGPIALLTQLSERKLCQWMLGYAAFAWLALQLVGVLSAIWLWSVGLQRVVSLVLGLGAFPALVIAWYHGERGRQDVSRIETAILTTLVFASAFIVWTYASHGREP